jgi:hypothetical protein
MYSGNFDTFDPFCALLSMNFSFSQKIINSWQPLTQSHDPGTFYNYNASVVAG